MAEKLKAKDLIRFLEMPYEEMINELKKKGVKPAEGWRDMLKKAKKGAFVISNVNNMEFLQEVKALLLKSYNLELSYQEFKDQFFDAIEKGGWYSDPAKGKPLNTHSRVNLIFRENFQHNFQSGRLQSHKSYENDFPYIRFVVTNDKNTTDICKFLVNNKFVLKISDPQLKNWYPPRHFQCRTDAVAINEQQRKRLGLQLKQAKSLPKKYQNAKTHRTLPSIPFSPDLSNYDPDLQKQYKKKVK